MLNSFNSKRDKYIADIGVGKVIVASVPYLVSERHLFMIVNTRSLSPHEPVSLVDLQTGIFYSGNCYVRDAVIVENSLHAVEVTKMAVS